METASHLFHEKESEMMVKFRISKREREGVRNRKIQREGVRVRDGDEKVE